MKKKDIAKKMTSHIDKDNYGRLISHSDNMKSLKFSKFYGSRDEAKKGLKEARKSFK